MTTTAADPTTAIAPREPSRMDELARLGQWLEAAESGRDDPKSKGAAAALRLFYAQQLGLTPLAAAELSLIRGKLVVSAKLQRALAAQAGFAVVRRDDSDQACTADLVRMETGEVIGSYTFTIADAQQAKLVKDGSAWKTHPARMLWARASTFVIADYLPAVTLGMLSEDEAAEITGRPASVPDSDPKASPVIPDSDIAAGLDEAQDAEFWDADADDLDAEFPAEG